MSRALLHLWSCPFFLPLIYIMNSIPVSTFTSFLTQFLNRLHRDAKYDAYNVFLLLMRYGFRLTELELIPQWTIDGDIISAPTKKNGNVRQFSLSNLPVHIQALVIDSISTGSNRIYYRDYSYYYGLSSSYVESFGFKINGSYSPTHMFRHFFIKAAIDSGQTAAWVQDFLGLVNPANVMVYYNSVVAFD